MQTMRTNHNNLDLDFKARKVIGDRIQDCDIENMFMQYENNQNILSEIIVLINFSEISRLPKFQGQKCNIKVTVEVIQDFGCKKMFMQYAYTQEPPFL